MTGVDLFSGRLYQSQCPQLCGLALQRNSYAALMSLTIEILPRETNNRGRFSLREVHLDNHTPCYSIEHRASSYSGVAMLIRFCFPLLCCGVLAACNQSKDSTGSDVNPAGNWAKVGETDSYVYYADHASIRKADETVTMSDLFDYKTAQVDGGGPPLRRREPSGNMTVRARRANRSSRAGSPGRWVPGPSCAPPLA